MKKIFPIFLCFLFLLSASACDEVSNVFVTTNDEVALDQEALDPDAGDVSFDEETPEEATESDADASAESNASDTNASGTLSIARSSKGYNPYITTDTLVEQTSSLLFENFIDISPDFELEYRLADSVVSSGTTVTITLNTGCHFADGSIVEPDDLAQSLLAAMLSETYSARFRNVLEITTTDTGLILTLATADSMFAYLLDIPVLKAEEVASTTPTASGRYTYGADENTLKKNPFAPFPTDGADEIQLVLVYSYDEILSSLALGEINYAIRGDSTTTDISSISYTEHYYKTNTLLFLGVNSYSDNLLCNTTQGRTLLSALINRDQLATDIYSARAYAARGAINSFYPIATDTHTILSTANDATLVDTMLGLGYTYNNASGFYQTDQGENATISILIHSGNTYKTLLASELSAEWANYGIEVTIITASDFNSFLTMLESGEFELYIGEMKLYNNIELSSFWDGSASYGINASESLLAAYQAFRQDTSNAAAFETAFAAEMPYIPLLWRNGIVLTSRSITGVSASVSNPLYALEDLTFSN